MSDTALNKFIASGDDTAEAAFTPNPAAGLTPAQAVLFVNTEAPSVPILKWWDGAAFVPISSVGSSRQLWQYRANTGATSGYPGDGKMLWDNATQTSATNLLFSHLTADALDIDIFLAFLASGDTIILQDQDASANFQEWSISGSPTNTNAGLANSYWTAPVTLTTSGGTGTTGFANNQRLIVAVFTAGGGGGTVTTTGSPANGNLTKFSGATSITNGNLSGDVTTAGTLATTIANSAVTLAKIQNAAANSRWVGSGSGGSGAAYTENTFGSGLTVGASSVDLSTAAKTRAIGISIDGGGSAITTGIKGVAYIPYACTITAVTMVADQSGSAALDIQTAAYNVTPSYSSIVAAAPPTLSSAVASQDTTLTGWTTSISAGTFVQWTVSSASTITQLNATLTVTV